jgi:glycosyltransferase involved in cell wall biosynthesis
VGRTPREVYSKTFYSSRLSKPMKILWFTPIPPKAALERKGRSANSTGFWIHSLLDLLGQREDIHLGVAYEEVGYSERFSVGRVAYFPIAAAGKIAAVTGLNFGHRRRILQEARRIIEEFQPDVIHVHGFESVFALIKAEALTTRPVVVSIQGMMGPWGRVAWGNKSFWQVAATQRSWDLVRGFPSLRSRSLFKQKAEDEVRALQTLDGVLGRTDFDRAYAWSIAPNVRYFHVGEIMRPRFYSEQWSIEGSEPLTLFTSGRLNFQKGIHAAIEAVAILKKVYPRIQLKIGGGLAPSGECLFMQRYVRKQQLSGNVHFLGWLPEDKLIRQLRCARVYINPSFIENSSNALSEAMLLGVPSVASMVGGTGSQMQHGKSGLLYPPDQPAMLAHLARTLIEDTTLARKLGHAGKAEASQRHNRDTVVEALYSTYRAIKAVGGNAR